MLVPPQLFELGSGGNITAQESILLLITVLIVAVQLNNISNSQKYEHAGQHTAQDLLPASACSSAGPVPTFPTSVAPSSSSVCCSTAV